MEFIERIFTDFSEIHGDRAYGDDEAVACGMARLQGEEVLVIGNRKGGSTKDRVRRNFGMPHPEGYRKALRVMSLGSKFGLPIICLVAGNADNMRRIQQELMRRGIAVAYVAA